MNKKSIGINAVINGGKTMLSVIFPLITFPYISRILEVDNLGRYNFSHSVIDYFYLLSSLGIGTYAVREGTRYRNSRKEISRFTSEVFTINVFSTVVSYLILCLTMLFSDKLHEYASIIMVLSVSMIFTTIGCEWVYTIYEEYLYIAIRTVVFQIISLILLFVFVREKDDVLWYAAVIVVSNSGANVINLLGLKKYCTIHICLNKRIFTHLIPVLVLFANSIATRIYVNSDITILGFLTSDYNVGIYTIASKIYSIAKQVLSAVIIVSIPRLSLLWGQNRKKEYAVLANRILYILVTFVVPASIGMFCLSKEIILVVSTEKFISANTPLRILCLALLVCLFNWFFTSCILIPGKKEKFVLLATAVSALINVILNFILIPYFEESAAAVTTLVAEACSLIICLWNSKDLIKIEIRWKDIISTVFGCAFIYMGCMLIKSFNLTPLICMLSSVAVSVIGYMCILLVLKNQSLISMKDEIGKKIKKKY